MSFAGTEGAVSEHSANAYSALDTHLVQVCFGAGSARMLTVLGSRAGSG